MLEYLKQLNQEQRKAAEHLEGPVMIIAGAGSGKTRVLTSRIAFLLQNNISPFNILALTFTNKAAKEMKERIDEMIGVDVGRDMWIGTFHSMFSKILRYESKKINFPSNFTIYDTEDSRSLIRSIIKELELDKDIYKPNMIRSRISSLKNNFINPENYNNQVNLIQQDKIAKRTEFGRIYTIYNARCHKANAMDFDDLLLKTYQLISQETEVLQKYQSKFRHILIDEYQDTNHVQYLIIKKLSSFNQNICVVGDDAQSIYSFRGARIQNILNFKKDYPNLKIYKLEQNYRSTSTIVKAANSIIKHNKDQITKNVWTKNKKGDNIIITRTESENEEARLVSSTISEIKRKNQTQNKHFAILYRTNAQSRAIEESLRIKGIEYKIYGGLSFYQRKEIKDLLAYFRLAINNQDEEALKRIINYPARGIGVTTINKLNLAAEKASASIFEIIKSLEKIEIGINKGTQKKLKEFSLMIEEFSSEIHSEDSYCIAEKIAKVTGILKNLYNDKSHEGISRLENVQELLNGIKEFANSHNNLKLSDFMQNVALITDQDNDNNDSLNKVTLMTIHASKGLEFSYVFVVGLEENLFPSLMSKESKESMEEERRLFYVAITRAKKRLFISFCSNRFKWGQFIDCMPSRFINEIDPSCIKKQDVISNNNERHSIKIKTKKYQKKTYNRFAPPNNLTNIKRAINNPIKSSNLEEITVGLRVKHSRFGIGKVLNLSGEGSNKKATVFFNEIGQKQLLLKFAKLEIIK